MIKFATLFIFCAIVALALFFYSLKQKASLPIFQTNDPMFVDEGVIGDDLNELSIEKLRQGRYSGSDIVVEETLAPGSNYKRYIVSYKSEGLKIYALLTV
ncbi:MAG: peptidase, partial [Candidatus Wolfebacteria bacterium GW2011_GWC1_37_10]